MYSVQIEIGIGWCADEVPGAGGHGRGGVQPGHGPRPPRGPRPLPPHQQDLLLPPPRQDPARQK